MSEVANTSASAGVERALAWAAGGAGVGLLVGAVFFADFGQSPWPVLGGAVLLLLAVALGFAAFVRSGGLAETADDDRHRPQHWNDDPPAYFGALAGVLAFSLVFGVMAGVATHVSQPVVGAERRAEAVALPGFTVVVPVTRTVDRSVGAYRATLAGWPPGDFAIEWQRAAIDFDQLARDLGAEFGRREGDEPVSHDDFSGRLWSFRSRSGYASVATGSCENGPWIRVTVRGRDAEHPAELARRIVESIECTTVARAPEPWGGNPRAAAAPSPVPRFVMPAGFGAVPTADGTAFRSLAGDTLAFRPVDLRAGSELARGRLEAALTGDGAEIEDFAPAAWPDGSARTEPVYSFVRIDGERRTPGLATVLPCPAQERAFVAVSLSANATTNLRRLEPIACPRPGEPAPAYETLTAAAERACKNGDTDACSARARLADTRDFRVLTLP